MSSCRAELLRLRAKDCEDRAHSYAERSATPELELAERRDLLRAGDALTIRGRVYRELAEIEDECEAAGDA